jgi:hypothetical protein
LLILYSRTISINKACVAGASPDVFNKKRHFLVIDGYQTFVEL